jgi:hypothetical protein
MESDTLKGETFCLSVKHATNCGIYVGSPQKRQRDGKTATHCARSRTPHRRYRWYNAIDLTGHPQSKNHPNMKAAKMLNKVSAGPVIDDEYRAPLSPVMNRELLHGVMPLRILVMATCIFAISDLTHAQDAAVSAACIADADPAVAGLEEKYAALEKVNMDLEGKLQELEKVNRNLDARVIQLKQTLLIADTAARRLSFNLARRVFRNVSRNVSTMAGTSIPYIGVGVSVAMTALDIKDGCESLKELNEMNRAMNLEKENESHVCTMQVPAKEEVIAQVITNWRTAYGNAAAWANQYEARLPPDPPGVSYPHAGELWVAVFGSNAKPVLQPLPMFPIVPTLPVLPTLPTLPAIKRPLN